VASFWVLVGHTLRRQGFRIALVLLVSLCWYVPPIGIVAAPWMIRFTVERISKSFGVTVPRDVGRALIVVSFLFAWYFPVLRKVGVMGCRVAHLVTRGSKNWQYFGIAVMEICVMILFTFPMTRPLASQFLSGSNMCDAVAMELLFPYTSRVRYAQQKALRRGAPFELRGFGTPFALVMMIPLVGPAAFTFAVGAAGHLLGSLHKGSPELVSALAPPSPAHANGADSAATPSATKETMAPTAE